MATFEVRVSECCVDQYCGLISEVNIAYSLNIGVEKHFWVPGLSVFVLLSALLELGLQGNCLASVCTQLIAVRITAPDHTFSVLCDVLPLHGRMPAHSGNVS